MITREHFVERVGSEPVNDDMDRVNCPHAGEAGHRYCGWSDEHDLPRFMCLFGRPILKRQTHPRRAQTPQRD